MKTGVKFGAFGIPSIITIILVLVLAVFSSLAVISARAEYSLAEKTAEAEKLYYAADAESERQIKALAESGMSCNDYVFTNEINSAQVLETTVSLENGKVTACKKTVLNIGTAEYDEKLNLMK